MPDADAEAGEVAEGLVLVADFGLEPLLGGVVESHGRLSPAVPAQAHVTAVGHAIAPEHAAAFRPVPHEPRVAAVTDDQAAVPRPLEDQRLRDPVGTRRQVHRPPIPLAIQSGLDRRRIVRLPVADRGWRNVRLDVDPVGPLLPRQARDVGGRRRNGRLDIAKGHSEQDNPRQCSRQLHFTDSLHDP